MPERGLYEKYTILDAETKQEKEGPYFVLKPMEDPAAIAAIKKYAEVTNNKELASDLLIWMEGLELIGVEQPLKCDYCEETTDKVRPTPFMADVGASMCKHCWEMTQKEYAECQDEHIGDFEDFPHFK
ncbi:hypothetical protein Gp_85 [Bacillus phage vB_Bacillus_1020A]|uniref:hypothetical protein n=1 Tax=Robertmurraya sp. DFI.2.37 TaxID=3031819 RepID=UPI001245F48F|nr:hypothetical protein [Robertmurraya sp. DFI.2.37]MDF1511471.1 hypothetical protein [Robertmurraya sp. DFI.2.37]QIW89359.1 hypothetical protein Gp_85 [Bacillus phage vB_Bacillus_1020A]